MSNRRSAEGMAELAAQVAPGKGGKRRATLRVYTVDDSRMLLKIYRSVMHNLGCEAIPFEFPAQAIERVRRDWPGVILTDLNMSDITGIDLTAKVRQRFSKEELPAIMVTTPQESRDFADALAVGVNGIIHKPFTESTSAPP